MFLAGEIIRTIAPGKSYAARGKAVNVNIARASPAQASGQRHHRIENIFFPATGSSAVRISPFIESVM